MVGGWDRDLAGLKERIDISRDQFYVILEPHDVGSVKTRID